MLDSHTAAVLLLTAKRNVVRRRDQMPIHAAADAYLRPMTLAVSYALLRGKKAYAAGGIDGAVDAVRDGLLESLPPVLLKCAVAGGQASVAGLRVAGDVEGHEFHGNQWTGTRTASEALTKLSEVSHGERHVSLTAFGVEHVAYNEMPNPADSAKDFVSQEWLSPSARVTSVQPSGTVDADKVSALVKTYDAWKDKPGLVDVHQHADGKSYVTDGHHHLVAARLLGRGVSASVTHYAGSVHALADIRTAAPKLAMAFNTSDPRAIKWAKEHAAELATDISETTRDRITAAIADALEEGEDPRDIIADAVGSDVRAELIARTETMRAASEGQRIGWDQAVDKGLLSGNEQRVWIATTDACPECDALDGKLADLDGVYPGEGEDGPPLHPNCRCTEGLIAGGDDGE